MTAVKPVKTRSITASPDYRLVESIRSIHWQTHTVYGLHDWSEPRRGLINLGRKALAIRAELDRRGVSSGLDCRFCGD